MAKPVTGAPPRRPSSITAAAGSPVSTTGFAPLVPPGTSAGGTEVVLCADFDRYGTRLVTGGADHRLRMYERVDDCWELVDMWRGHNGMVLDVKFSPLPSSTMPLFASTGEDLRLKVWASDPSAPSSSGRRFFASFSQSAGHAAVAYVALALAAPAMPSPDLLLAAVTRDGVLSLLEAVPEVEQRAAAGTTALTGNGAIGANRRQGQDWRELDQIYAADGLVPRGTETCFRLAFQPFPTPTSYMNSASIGTHPLSLAIASLNEVRIYPVIPPSPYPTPNTSAFASSPNAATGSYHFGSPLAVLSAGNGRLVRDVAWSPAAHRTSAWIAAAAADGTVRVYDVASPKTGRGTGLGTPNHPSANNDGITGSNNGAPGSTSPLPGGTPGNTFGERIPTAPPPASTLTASLSRAAQPQLSPHPTTSALFPGAPSTTHLPSQGNTAEADLSGVAPAYSQGASSPGLGGGLSVGSSGPRLEVKLVAELPHQGVWRVAWVRTGAMVISMGDSGQGHVWGPGMGGNWVEFAEFGAESEGE